ncbi:hypothetical protein LguiB_006086 [Lonicera macranthoides]
MLRGWVMGTTEFGKAVAVGSSTCNKAGNTIPVAAKEGDVVLLPMYDGTQVGLGDRVCPPIFIEYGSANDYVPQVMDMEISS